jgi:hypothetical protein
MDLFCLSIFVFLLIKFSDREFLIPLWIPSRQAKAISVSMADGAYHFSMFVFGSAPYRWLASANPQVTFHFGLPAWLRLHHRSCWVESREAFKSVTGLQRTA